MWTSEKEHMRSNEGAIQSHRFSDKPLEGLMLIDILVIWSYSTERTFFLENLLLDLMLLTVYVMIFLQEWDKMHLISSLNGYQSK